MSKVTEWKGCYDDGWQDLIVPEAFAHPAKFARGLIERIIRHGLERGYWKPGDVVADPFGGVALGGIVAAYHGLRWIGVELEPRFVELGNANIALHAAKLAKLGAPLPVLVQGDSRHFAEIVGPLAGAVTSPPYNLPMSQDHNGTRGGNRGTTPSETGAFVKYGRSEGQIEGCPAGSVEACVTSPPYAEGLGHDSGHPRLDAKEDRRRLLECRRRSGYGTGEGQIGALPAGNLAATITSPPYADSSPEKSGPGIDIEKQWATYREQGGGMSLRKFREQQARHSQDYGATAGQIGRCQTGNVEAVVTSPPYEEGLGHKGVDKHPERACHNSTLRQMNQYGGYSGPDSLDAGQIGQSSGETYWQAVAAVYRSVFAALKPGGVLAVVVKSYVKNKAIVDLPDQTLTLLQHIGFLPVERVHAMLTKTTETPGLFQAKVSKTTARKSFFRRLAESHGSPPIDCEEVLFVRKSIGKGVVR